MYVLEGEAFGKQKDGSCFLIHSNSLCFDERNEGLNI